MLTVMDWRLLGEADPDAPEAAAGVTHPPPHPDELVCLDCPLPKCRQYSPKCINPRARAQHGHGEAANPRAFAHKLTDAQRREVRRRYQAGEHEVALAREYGLDRSTVHNIGEAIRGYAWLADPDSTRGRE